MPQNLHPIALVEHLGVRLPASPAPQALDDQQLLAIEGSPRDVRMDGVSGKKRPSTPLHFPVVRTTCSADDPAKSPPAMNTRAPVSRRALRAHTHVAVSAHQRALPAKQNIRCAHDAVVERLRCSMNFSPSSSPYHMTQNRNYTFQYSGPFLVPKPAAKTAIGFAAHEALTIPVLYKRHPYNSPYPFRCRTEKTTS